MTSILVFMMIVEKLIHWIGVVLAVGFVLYILFGRK